MADVDQPEEAAHSLACEVGLEPATDALTRKLRVAVRHDSGDAVSNVRLLVRFEDSVTAGLAFETSPGRALLGKLTTGAGGEAQLHIERIEPNETRAYLFHVRAEGDELGTAEVRYQIADGERTLQVSLGAAVAEADPAIDETPADQVGRRESATSALEAYRGGDRPRCAESLRHLLDHTTESERAEVEEMLARLEAGATLTHEMLDLCYRLSHDQEEPEAANSVFDVILIAAGESPIAVAREIRAATGLPLRDVTDILEQRVAIGHALPFAQAGALRRRVEAAGGAVEIHRRDAPLDEPPAPEPEPEPDKKRKRRRRWR